MALTKPRAYQIYDIDYKQAVRVVSTTNITLSGGAPNSVDGATLSLNDRVLVTGQSSKSQNGIYYVTTLGSGSNGTWARSVDANTTGEVLAGMIVMVTEGSQYADTQWKLLTNDPIVIGVTELTFAQNFGVPYTAATVPPTANVVVGSQWFDTSSNLLYEYMYDGTSYYWIDLTGPAIGSNGAVTGSTLINGTSNISVTGNGNATVSISGTSNVVVFATTGEYVNGIVSATSNITGGNLLTGGLISSTGNITSAANVSGGNILGSTVSASGNITGANVAGATAVLVGDPTSTSTQKLRLTTTGTAIFVQVGNGVSGTTGNITFSPYFQETAQAIINTTSGNITGGNLLTGGLISATSNITGGNISTAGQASVTGMITVAGAVNGTGITIGNSAVNNCAIAMIPTAGTAAGMAIRDYSTVASTIYLDVGMGSANTAGNFIFRGSNVYTQWAKIDQYGVNQPTRPAFRVYGNTSTNFTSGTTLTNQVIDYNQGSNYVNSTGVFTAPVGGLYSVWLNARAGATASLSQIGVFRNNDTSGANVCCFWEITTSATQTTHFGVSSVVKLTAGDTLRAKVVAGGINFDSNDNWGAAYIG